RQLIANPPPDKHSLLQKEVKELKQYIEEIFTDQNDINEDTRMQLELINQTLAELQVHQKLSDKPYRPIGFIRPEED
ncbi:ORF6N domain-containing protein, partial [Odoribacter splanchnicus]|nr:ORF6N domain-containing protein [Odoribacter splanchnicus]MDB9216577.1 ORF6N domain-containing protein [Odoribacter splanchnicus]